MKYLFLHHTADPESGKQFSSVNAYHEREGFPKSLLGFYVGYTYFIEKSGEAIQARSEEEMGAHTRTPMFPDANKSGIAICLAGDFTQQNPTIQQFRALASLSVDIQIRHSIPEPMIYLHREVEQGPTSEGYSNTSCPGQDLRALTKLARKMVLQQRITQLSKAQIRSTGDRAKEIALALAAAQSLLSAFQ